MFLFFFSFSIVSSSSVPIVFLSRLLLFWLPFLDDCCPVSFTSTFLISHAFRFLRVVGGRVVRQDVQGLEPNGSRSRPRQCPDQTCLAAKALIMTTSVHFMLPPKTQEHTLTRKCWKYIPRESFVVNLEGFCAFEISGKERDFKESRVECAICESNNFRILLCK